MHQYASYDTTAIILSDDRLIDLHTQVGEVTRSRYQYTLDRLGQRTAVTETLGLATRVITYAYDGLQRLSSAGESPGTIYGYGYDDAGNRTGVWVNGSQVVNQSYDAADQVVGYTYDDAGNLLDDGTHTYDYDPMGWVIQRDGTSYTYDADGVLTTETTGGATISYTQDLAAPLSQVLLTLDGGTTTDHLYGLDRLASETGGTRTWYGADALGSVRQTLNAGGAVLSSVNYDPWGTVESGTTPGFGFTGEIQDSVGMIYLRARWYNPAQGTFTAYRWRTDESDDEIPYSHHGYAYALGDPVLLTDPRGTCAYTEDRRGCAGGNFGAQVLAVVNQYGSYSHLYDTQRNRRIYDTASAAYRFMDAHPAEAAAYVPPHPQGPVDPVLASAISAYGYGSYEDGVNELRYLICNWQIDHGGPCSGGAAVGAIAVVVPFGVDDICSPYALHGGSAAYGGKLNSEAARSELTNSLSNLGGNAAARNATILADYTPTPSKGTAFSGVYDPETGQFLLRPSGDTRLANGAVPENLVSPRGGHRVVNRQLGDLAGVNTQNTVGFTAFYEEEGELTIEWLSRSVNGINYQSDYAPQQFRQPIMDAIQQSTGLRVTSR